MLQFAARGQTIGHYRISGAILETGVKYIPTSRVLRHPQTLRPCPRCKTRMFTDKHGKFWCDHCGYKDFKDVEKFRAAGLDYHNPVGAEGARARGTGWVIIKDA